MVGRLKSARRIPHSARRILPWIAAAALLVLLLRYVPLAAVWATLQRLTPGSLAILAALNGLVLLALPMTIPGKTPGRSEFPANMPTYQQATGFDPATANMTMCSDGALREDCSDAPEGY